MRLPIFRFPAVSLLALALAACGKSGGMDGSVVLPQTGAPTSLNYGSRVLNLEVGQASTFGAPTVGGADSTFAVTPDLPDGLVLDEDTGAISGTPTATTARTPFVVTASNSLGSSEQTILLQVGGGSRFVFAGSETGQTFRVYGTQPDGDTLYHHSWTEDFVPAPNTGGTDDSLRRTSISQDGRVICATTDTELRAFLVDPVTGAMTAGPAESLTTVDDLHAVAVHPTGNFVYVASRTIKLVRAYSINPVTGALTMVASFPTGTQVNLIQVDPLGRYVLVRHVYQFTLNYTQVRSFVVNTDGSNIVETQLFTIPASNARGMEIGALGEAVYFPITSNATNPPNVLLQCGVTPSTGKLSLKGFVTAGTNPTLVHAAPNGKHLYVTDPDESNLNVFNIAGLTRNLTLSLQDIPVSPTLDTLSFSSDGSELYLTDTDRSEVVVQSLNASNGSFGASSSLYTRAGGLRLLQAPGEAPPVLRANRLYGLNESGSHIKPFDVDPADGTLLDTLNPTLVPTGTPRDMAVDPMGRFLFTGSRTPNGLDSFSIQSNGEVADLSLHVDLGTAAPVALAADPTGNFLYVACDTTLEIRTFGVQASGALTQMDTDALVGEPTSVTVCPGGEFLYVTIGGDGSPGDGVVSLFRIDAVNGDLAPVTDLPTPGFPNAMAFTPSGELAYVSLEATTGVRLYTVNVDGTLTEGTETNSQPLPNDISLTNDGRFAYVTFTGPTINSDGLLLYEVDSDTGVLHGGQIGGADTWADSAFSGDDCSQSLVSHDGAEVYVLASGSDEIWCFDTDSVSGQVAFKAIAQPGASPVRIAFTFVRE